MTPKISIILPIYNVEKYLDRCMNTILNQTIKDIEVILVDDGSPDKAPMMCDQYAKKDNRVKVIHQTNKGAGLARNEGMKIATGEFYAFIDSDDYIELDMLERMYRIAKEKNLDAVCCGITNLNPDGSIKYKQYCYPEYTQFDSNLECKKIAVKTIKTQKIQIQDKLFQFHRWAAWRFIFKAEVIINNNVKFPSEREVFSEDLMFNVRFMTYAKSVAYIPDFLIFHCYNQESLTAQRGKITDNKRITNQFVMLQDIISNNEYPTNANRTVCNWFIMRVFINLQNIARANLKYKNKLELAKQLVDSKEAVKLLENKIDFKIKNFRLRMLLKAMFKGWTRTMLLIAKM